MDWGGPAEAEDFHPSHEITEKTYIEFLDSSSAPGSDTALRAFENADKETRDEFISKLNDPDFIKALFSNDDDVLADQGLTRTSMVPLNSLARAASAGQVTNTYNRSMDWGPIPTLNISQTYTITTDGSTVTSSDSCVATYTAFIPIAGITERTIHQVKNGHGYCRTDWSAELFNHPGWVYSSVQDQEVDGFGNVLFQNFYDI